MSFVIDWQELFNRKERYFLLQDALGKQPLRPEFREKLGKKIGLDFPEHAKWWMDYHFDWIFASLRLADTDPHSSGLKDLVFESPDFGGSTGALSVFLNQNQEDVDLLVAFQDGEVTQLVLVEAKGATRFSNAQLASKLHRMRIIFDAGAGWYRSDLQPHFVLTSPKRPRKLTGTAGLPDWLARDGVPRWIPMTFPENQAIIQRYDGEARRPSKSATTWRLRQVPASQADQPTT
jgi:hypothetical protein